MKPVTFLRRAPAATIAIFAAACISSAGAYAVVTNWFGGTVNSRQDGSVFTVDVSSCPAFFPGLEPDQQAHMQFKIVKDTGLTADGLKQRVLQLCEFYAAEDFVDTKTPLGTLHITSAEDYQHRDVSYDTYRAKVKTVQMGSITVTLFDRTVGIFKDVTLPMSADVLVYNQGKPGSLNDITAGSSIVFATKISGSPAKNQDEASLSHSLTEGTVVSIFKTQYDMLESVQHEKAFYDDNGIMPLSMYQEIHKKQ